MPDPISSLAAEPCRGHQNTDLVLNTTGDKTAPVQLHGGRLIELLKAHNKVFESKIYDNAPGGHIFAEVDSPEARDSEQRIFEFLAKYLHPQAAP